MLDDRTALAKGAAVESEAGVKYTIIEEAGRGASCIVYSAFCTDTSGHRHLVRLKECYPCHLDIRRKQNGGLEAPPGAEDAFEGEKKQFEAAYAKNVALKHTLGLINSTVDAMDLFSGHHTRYSVMACMEGRDYRRDADENLQSLFTRILTLAKIIKKYHDHGVLYLDIKPENIFLIPETKEHMILFDFDSLVEKEKLRDGTAVRLSFSDGFAAPELARGNRNRICEGTDIYSIGAVVFYKLFGRTPNAFDGAVEANYDFSQMKIRDERCQPDLFRELSVFLHKTIAPSVFSRYQCIDTLIAALETLIRMSDAGRAFLYHNFSYNSACFIGRREELLEIGEIFDSGQQLVFLSGIGGIGKTELAKRYAFENAGKYEKVVFVPFADSILETVCRDDLRINGVEQGEEETNGQYFERKLGILKTVVSANDLIILDNFDVDYDENLEKILECPCRFLITSREVFRDYDYTQIDVERLGEAEEILQLFRVYHPQEYGPEEQEQIQEIIEIVDQHTMTVELIAKYLRTTGERPGILLKKLLRTEGIAGTEETGVRHRKDRRLRAESIHNHLLALFDLSGFSAKQEEMMRSLSLLGYVRIAKKRFCEYCGAEDHETELDILIRRGWVEYDEASGKISLHQIILDLVYNDMQPCAENCPHIVGAMTDYLRESMPNHVERRIQRKLLGYFIRRVRGANLAYAGLCVSYCEHIARHSEYLDRAEEICLPNAERGSRDLLQRICRVKMQAAGSDDDLSAQMLERDDFDEDRYWEEKSVEVCRLARKAYAYARDFSEEPAFLGTFCIELAGELDGIVADSLFWSMQTERQPYLDRIMDLMMNLLDDAAGYFLKSGLDLGEKRRLFRQMQEFYRTDDYTSMYRSIYYGNAETAYKYQQIIDSLREPGDASVYIGPGHADLSDLAKEAEEQGEYQKAVEYYQKACGEGTEPYQTALRQIAHIYLKLDDRDTAKEYLERILEIDREREYGHNVLYTNHVCCELIDLFMEEKNGEKARKYSEELIHYNIRYVEEENNAFHIKWLIAAYYRLYKIEPCAEKKQEYWKSAAMYFSMLPEEETCSEELVEFLVELADHQEKEADKIQKAFAYRERAKDGYMWENTIPFLDYILRLCEEKPEYARQQVMARLCYSEALSRMYAEQGEEALSHALRANELYDQSGMEDAYVYSLIHKAIGHCYSNSNDYDYDQALEEKKKCNYLLLAEHDAAGKSEEQRIEIWKEAARAYNEVENSAMEELCYERLFAVFDPILGRYAYSGFDEYWYAALDQVSCYMRLKKWQKAGERIIDLYEKLLGEYGKRARESDSGNSAREFRDRLITCADKLAEAQRENEAFWMYIMAIPAGVNGTISTKWRCADDTADAVRQRELWTEFSSVLHGTVTSRNVEDIINIYEKVKPVLEQDVELEEFYKELRWFSERYQYQNIEFKR